MASGQLVDTMTKEFKQLDIVTDFSDHFYKDKNKFADASPDLIKRISKEWSILQECLPETIFVRAYEGRIDLLRAVIMGVDDTPYRDGLFFFDLAFPSNYPDKPPLLHFDSRRLRIHQDLHALGEVCLSLLNTCSGEDCEPPWDPSNSTILQVLVSLQGIVLNAKPYFNVNPGLSDAEREKPAVKKASHKYNTDQFSLSCKLMLYILNKPPKNFEDLITGHFHRRANGILKTCVDCLKGHATIGYPKEDESIKIRMPAQSFRDRMRRTYDGLVVAFNKIAMAALKKPEEVVEGKRTGRKRKADSVKPPVSEKKGRPRGRRSKILKE